MQLPDAGALDEAAQALGLPLDREAADKLLRYLALLQRWNAAYNLTGVRDPARMLVQHLSDCMAVVPPLRRHLGSRRARLLDVGSGAGLPGVVVAVLCPNVDVTCVDAVGKKVAFIRQVAAELELGTLHAEHGRVEHGAGRFDVVASRAFGSLSDLCRLTRSRLGDGGVWLAMKGQVPQDEVDALPGDVEAFHVEQLLVPGLGAERCLVWMRPAGRGDA